MCILLTMKKKRGIIESMKAHKTVSLIVAAFIVVGGVGTALALKPAPVEPKKASVEQITSAQPTQTQATTTESTPVVTETATSVVSAPEPVETVDSVLDSQGWSTTGDPSERWCVDETRRREPFFFKDVQTVKGFIQATSSFESMCYGIYQTDYINTVFLRKALNDMGAVQEYQEYRQSQASTQQ